jgi:hypothetical protein
VLEISGMMALGREARAETDESAVKKEIDDTRKSIAAVASPARAAKGNWSEDSVPGIPDELQDPLSKAQNTLYGPMSITKRFPGLTGKKLQDRIFEVYQRPDSSSLTTVPWFLPDGTKGIARHPLNQRNPVALRNSYILTIKEYGIISGVRGEPWLVENKNGPLLAITFGTLPIP